MPSTAQPLQRTRISDIAVGLAETRARRLSTEVVTLEFVGAGPRDQPDGSTSGRRAGPHVPRDGIHKGERSAGTRTGRPRARDPHLPVRRRLPVLDHPGIAPAGLLVGLHGRARGHDRRGGYGGALPQHLGRRPLPGRVRDRGRGRSSASASGAGRHAKIRRSVDAGAQDRLHHGPGVPGVGPGPERIQLFRHAGVARRPGSSRSRRRARCSSPNRSPRSWPPADRPASRRSMSASCRCRRNTASTGCIGWPEGGPNRRGEKPAGASTAERKPDIALGDGPGGRFGRCHELELGKLPAPVELARIVEAM